MPRERVTDAKAKWLADEFRKTGSLRFLVKGASDASAWLGRFGKKNKDLFRDLFVDSLIEELERKMICPNVDCRVEIWGRCENHCSHSKEHEFVVGCRVGVCPVTFTRLECVVKEVSLDDDKAESESGDECVAGV